MTLAVENRAIRLHLAAPRLALVEALPGARATLRPRRTLGVRSARNRERARVEASRHSACGAHVRSPDPCDARCLRRGVRHAVAAADLAPAIARLAIRARGEALAMAAGADASLRLWPTRVELKIIGHAVLSVGAVGARATRLLSIACRCRRVGTRRSAWVDAGSSGLATDLARRARDAAAHHREERGADLAVVVPDVKTPGPNGAASITFARGDEAARHHHHHQPTRSHASFYTGMSHGSERSVTVLR
jgi:hypothetical protein